MRNFNRLFISLLCFTFIFSNCKKDKEVFKASTDCAINDLAVDVLECNDSLYTIELNFIPVNAIDDKFFIHDRNYSVLGHWTFADLPLTLSGFRTSNDYEYLKVALTSNSPDTCQAEIEFFLEDCDSTVVDECEIYMEIIPGECCPGDLDAFSLTIDGFVQVPGSEIIQVYDRNQLIGNYRIDQLPVTIDKFPSSNQGLAYVRICSFDGEYECCIEREFEAPDCGNSGCSISDLMIDMGDCTCEDAFNMTINFDYQNVNADYFDIYGSSGYFGSFRLDQLPVTLENYPHNGSQTDFLNVIINDECEAGADFRLPDCDPHGGGCEISDLTVLVDSCRTDQTYIISIDFEYPNIGNGLFDLYTSNNQYLGLYSIAELPLKIYDFRWSGNTFDYIKVCISGNPDCCVDLEFAVPDCILGGGNDCLIKDLVVEPGDCTSDSTYVVNIDFEVIGNPVSDKFSILDRGGIYMGTFSRRDLPLRLAPWFSSGRDYDYIKVCIDGTNFTCCEEIEWKAPPDCS